MKMMGLSFLILIILAIPLTSITGDIRDRHGKPDRERPIAPHCELRLVCPIKGGCNSEGRCLNMGCERVLVCDTQIHA